MTRFLSSLLAHMRRFRLAEAGTATLEFILVFPPTILLLMSGAEAGLLNLQNVMLERGLDIAMRDVRIHPTKARTHPQVIKALCDAAIIIPDCRKSVVVEMRAVSRDDWKLIDPQITCADRKEKIQPEKGFKPGQPTDLMMVRACLKLRPIFPTTGLGLMMPKDANGDYASIAATTFVNEP